MIQNRSNTNFLTMPEVKFINLEDDAVQYYNPPRAQRGERKPNDSVTKSIYMRSEERKRVMELLKDYNITSITRLFQIFLFNTKTSVNANAPIDLSDKNIVRPPERMPDSRLFFGEREEKRPRRKTKKSTNACMCISFKTDDINRMNKIMEEYGFISVGSLLRTYVWNAK